MEAFQFDANKFLTEFKEGIDTIVYDPKELAAAQFLYDGLQRGWSMVDRYDLLVSIKLLLVSANGEKRDNGVDPTSTHSLEVANIVLNELDGAPQDIIGAVIHDIPEDTKKRGTNVITIDHIGALFGEAMARRIDGLTKVKSKKNQDLPVQTHHKIYEVFVESAKIKLADRLHSLRTLQFLTPEQQERKARESLNIYIPLAKSVGYHKAAHEMTYWSVYYLLPPDERDKLNSYASVELKLDDRLDLFQGALSEISAQVSIILPNLYDLYQASNGNIEEIFTHTIPSTAMIVIPEGFLYSAHEGNGADKKLWREKATLAALQLYANGLITGGQFLELSTAIGRKRKDVQIVSQIGGNRTKIRFIDKTYFEYRSANLADFDNPGSPRHAFALDKITRLQENYRRIQNSKSAFQTAIEFSELLQGGAIVVLDADDRPYRLPEGATALDAAFAFKSRLLRHVSGVQIFRDRQLLDNAQLSDVLEHEDRIVFTESVEPNVTMQPAWIDLVRTSGALGEIQRYFRDLMKNERSRNIPLAKRPATSHFRNRGIAILETAFKGVSQQAQGEIQEMFVDLKYAEDWFEQLAMKYPTIGKPREQKCTNFLISVGLRELEMDDNQTSFVWGVARHLWEFQKSLRTVEFDVVNSSGSLGSILSLIGEARINIEHMVNSSMNAPPGYLTVQLSLHPKDLARFQANAEKLFRELIRDGQIQLIRYPTVI